MELDKKYYEAMDMVMKEVTMAKSKYKKDFNSRHEAYGVLLEEVDELWDDVKADAEDGRDIMEAVQVAAMALRYVAEFKKFSSTDKVTIQTEVRGNCQDNKFSHDDLENSPVHKHMEGSIIGH